MSKQNNCITNLVESLQNLNSPHQNHSHSLTHALSSCHDRCHYSLILLCLTSLVESRVSFPFSEVLDRDDLQMKATTFHCDAGCRVYSPNALENVVITDRAGERVYYNLKQLSELKMGEFYELPARSEPYWLHIRDNDWPKLVFYVIEKGAPNYDTKVLYVKDSKMEQVIGEPILTVLSSTGAVHFSYFDGLFTDYLPEVYATGFDSFAMCRPVYKARSAASIRNTAFPVFSPIATVYFKTATGGKQVRVSGDPKGDISAGLDTSSVYSSPGYVGCGTDEKYESVLDTHIMKGFDSVFTVQNDDGLHVRIEGDYSLKKEDAVLTVSVNEIEQNLNGTDHCYAMDYTPAQKNAPVEIGVKWEREYFNKDNFAIQID
ncbi:hypothetical protein PMAYCL1PPCAC_21762, partial [Pristionchus mayeri]